MTTPLSRLAVRTKKKCANPKCDNWFWKNGTQKYCDNICMHYMKLRQMNKANKKYRGIGIRQLRNFGYWLKNLEDR